KHAKNASTTSASTRIPSCSKTSPHLFSHTMQEKGRGDSLFGMIGQKLARCLVVALSDVNRIEKVHGARDVGIARSSLGDTGGHVGVHAPHHGGLHALGSKAIGDVVGLEGRPDPGSLLGVAPNKELFTVPRPNHIGSSHG